MSRVSSKLRWARAVGVVGIVPGAIMFGVAAPASANTNFNGDCESSEACVWRRSYNESVPWDYEGTDTNFSNNYYPRSGPNLNNTMDSAENKGTGCTAVFGENVGGQSAQGWTIRLGRGSVWSGYPNDSRVNEASSLWWVC